MSRIDELTAQQIAALTREERQALILEVSPTDNPDDFTNDQWEKLCDASDLRQLAEHRQDELDRQAYVDRWARHVTVQDARELIEDATERAAHLRGCHQDVSRCSVCSDDERIEWEEAETRRLQVTAARKIVEREPRQRAVDGPGHEAGASIDL
jgi:hypothetical protein